jgi:pyruvate kinase
MLELLRGIIYYVLKVKKEKEEDMRKTKIICTIGPASDSEEKLRELMEAGMDVARLNFSHGSHEEHGERIARIKKIRNELGKYTAILLDTKGPEIRTGDMEGGSVELETGQTFTIRTDDSLGTKEHCSITYKALPKFVSTGSKILFDDGLIEMTVTGSTDAEIECTVENSGTLGSKKGVNVPGTKTDMPALNEKDKADLLFGIEQDVDFYAISFVRSAQDAEEVREFLKANGEEDPFIISKIENREALADIDAIIEKSDGIMVARGDLGVEIPTERVPIEQKNIIRECNEKGKVVITATQMLDSMIHNPRPTRAEAGDVSNAILDGTDVIMLSGETAAGQYPTEAVKMMDQIAVTAEQLHLRHKYIMSDIGYRITTNAVASATYRAAEELDVAAIVTPTSSGHTAFSIAGYRPQAPILGLSRFENVLRRLSMCWGTLPVKVAMVNNDSEREYTEDVFAYSVKAITEAGLVHDGDRIITLVGLPRYIKRNTNTMRIHVIGDPM